MTSIKMIGQSLRLMSVPTVAREALKATVRIRLLNHVGAKGCATRCWVSGATTRMRAVERSEEMRAKMRENNQELRKESSFRLKCRGVPDSLTSKRSLNLEATTVAAARMSGCSGQRRRHFSSVVDLERKPRRTGDIINFENRTIVIATANGVATVTSGNRLFSSGKVSARKRRNKKDSPDSETSAPAAQGGEKTSVKIAPASKEAFARNRKAGVTRRLLEGGGVPRNFDLNAHGSDDAPIEMDRTIFEAVWEEEDQGSDDCQECPVEEDAKLKTSTSKGDGTSSPLSTNIYMKTGGQQEKADEGDAAGVRPKTQESAKSSGDNAAPPKWEERKRSQGKLHPVLGKLVADLKYKRVYLTSAEALTKAPVWEKANTLFPVRAQEIADAKFLQDGVVEGMPGIITLYKRPLRPITKKKQAYTLGIVDGQHRLGAMLLLADKGRWERAEHNIVVEVFDTKSEEEVATLFAEINRAEPMQVIEVRAEGEEEMKESVSKVAMQLNKMFPEAFGTKRARAPSVHAAAFKENIIKSGLIQRHELFNSQLLLDYLLRVNEMISRREPKIWGSMVGKEDGKYPTKKALGNAIRRAKRSKFYLGLDVSWMLA